MTRFISPPHETAHAICLLGASIGNEVQGIPIYLQVNEANLLLLLSSCCIQLLLMMTLGWFKDAALNHLCRLRFCLPDLSLGLLVFPICTFKEDFYLLFFLGFC